MQSHITCNIFNPSITASVGVATLASQGNRSGVADLIRVSCLFMLLYQGLINAHTAKKGILRK